MLIDSRWAGGQFGGYCPVRFRVTNHGRSPRELTFRFQGSGDVGDLPDVERTVRVDPNATLRFSLSLPLFSAATSGVLHVSEDGQRLPQLSTTINVAEAYQTGGIRTALLLVTPDTGFSDLTAYETAVTISGFGRQMYMPGGGGVRDEDHVVLPPQSLPDQWIDYSGLDVVALSLETLRTLPAAVRGAILKWTECGGTLIVFSTEDHPAKSADLRAALELDQRRMQQPDWQGAPVQMNSEISAGLWQLDLGVTSGEPRPANDVELRALSSRKENTNAWKAGPDAFYHRRLMLGRVYAFTGDAFKGNVRDWAWWLNTLEPAQRSWADRHGGSARSEHNEFSQFLIPGVGQVPTVAFLTMITVFTILIGPVNYFVLLARKQLYLLVVTIPVFAFLTSCALFAYAVIADGFGVRSRVRSVTLIDQTRNTAISMSRVSLYAGLVPSSGLNYSPETMVLPVWPQRAGVAAGLLDWTQSQHYSQGMLQSRTYSQFATTTHRNERGRLEVKTPASGERELWNGLRWTLKHVLVQDQDDQFWHAENVPAGASARLGPAQPAEIAAMIDLINADDSNRPAGYIVPQEADDPYTLSYRYEYDQYRGFKFDESLMEQSLRHLRELRAGNQDGFLSRGLPPVKWIAIVETPPDVDLGVATTPSTSFNLILGWE